MAAREETADGVKVAGRSSRPALGAGRNVHQQIQLPAEQLVSDQLQERHDGRLLGQMLQLLDAHVLLGRQLLVGPRHEHRILLHVSGIPVVAGVGDFPREVGHHQKRVGGPADEVVEGLVVREGAVAALVGQDPESRTHAALEEAIGGPGDDAQGQRRQQVDMEGAVGQDGAVEDVAGQIQQ